MAILVFAENVNGVFKKPTFEALSYATAVAKNIGTEVHAVAFGTVSDEQYQSLAAYGAAKIYAIKHSALSQFVGPAYASAVAEVAKKTQARMVIIPQTYNGRAIAPRIAVKLDAAMFSGVISLINKSESGFEVQRSAYSLKAIETVSTNRDRLVITLKGNAYKLEKNRAAGVVEDFAFEPSAKDLALKPVRVIKASSKIGLTEADTIVSAGRGLKGPENWGMIEELADLLGAATACSKPVADVEWRPHHEHVGQTGIQVSPNVYIAIGISGSIQHLAGVSASKTIVVINSDPEAPFFKAADVGVVGDAFQVVPALIESVKKYKATH
jgi:electron transfer flavoprotein alpha subunit